MEKFNLSWKNKGEWQSGDPVWNAEMGQKVTDNIDELIDVIGTQNADFHNSIFRGKDITSYLDDGSLWTRISSGKFNDLFVGDYIFKNNIAWRVAGFDVYYNKGNPKFITHHLCIIPDIFLMQAQMNVTNTTSGGYVGSKMFTETLPSVLNTHITPVFGTHVLEFPNLLSNSVSSSGKSDNWNYYNRKLDLLNEVQIYGTIIWSSSGYDVGSNNSQLPLFRLSPQSISNRNSYYWLRSVVDSSSFSVITYDGIANTVLASSSTGGVRPFFYIG